MLLFSFSGRTANWQEVELPLESKMTTNISMIKNKQFRLTMPQHYLSFFMRCSDVTSLNWAENHSAMLEVYLMWTDS